MVGVRRGAGKRRVAEILGGVRRGVEELEGWGRFWGSAEGCGGMNERVAEISGGVRRGAEE